MIADAFLIGLGVFALVGAVKALLPWPLQAWTKRLVVLIFCGIGASVLVRGQGWQAIALVASGSAGLAGLLHELASLLSLASDDLKSIMLSRYSAGQRSRRTM